jgi:hypothetical protein
MNSHFNAPLAPRSREVFAHRMEDPWTREIDDAVHARDAVPLCVDCLCPLEGHHWFCPHCGFPAADCVMIMPYLQIFPVAEVLRRGVMGPPENGFAKKFGFVILSLAQYSVFAPIYWYWMARKAGGRPICQAKRHDLKFEEEA